MVLSGLPGVGKTTLARRVGALTGAVHLRIDTVEVALHRAGVIDAAGGWDRVPDAGYRVAYALAADLLGAGHHVVADCVNPFPVTRRAWAEVAERAGAALLTVEVVCGDPDLHRQRVRRRRPDLPGLVLPTWEQVRGAAHRHRRGVGRRRRGPDRGGGALGWDPTGGPPVGRQHAGAHAECAERTAGAACPGRRRRPYEPDRVMPA